MTSCSPMCAQEPQRSLSKHPPPPPLSLSFSLTFSSTLSHSLLYPLSLSNSFTHSHSLSSLFSLSLSTCAWHDSPAHLSKAVDDVLFSKFAVSKFLKSHSRSYSLVNRKTQDQDTWANNLSRFFLFSYFSFSWYFFHHLCYVALMLDLLTLCEAINRFRSIATWVHSNLIFW